LGRINANIGDKVLLKGNFVYPYSHWSCDDMVGYIISKDTDCGNNFFSILFNSPFPVYKVMVEDTMVHKLEIRPKNIKKILNKRIFNEVDPYGEEDWSD
jgi:hypothetical protein